MSTVFAITAILALALGITCLQMASGVKMWRMWWMDLLGAADVETDRISRKRQERQMALVYIVLFLLFFAVALSTSYWAYVEVRESRRDKSLIEREVDMARLEIEKVRLKIRR